MSSLPFSPLAVLLAALSTFLVGGLWYSPVLFGKIWQRETGLSDETLRARNQAKIFGTSFVLALLMMGSIREVLGSGTFLGHPLFGPDFEPWVVMVLPPGGFFTLAFWLLLLAWTRARRQAQGGEATQRRAA